MAQSLRINIASSFALTAANYLFPFIVYPYVARVLGPDDLGACNYVDGIVNYTCAISLMGTSVAGVRMAAKYCGCPQKLSEGFTAIMAMSAVFTVLASALLFLAMPVVGYRELMLIGQLKLWSSFFLIEWLYKGLEDFKYITTRAVAIKIVYVGAVFMMVRAKSDYTVYFLLLALSDAANSCVNCIKASRFVHIRFSSRAFRELWRPFLILGIYALLTNMYTTFNVVYLGYESSSEAEVAYYALAAKMLRIALALYSAYTVVILPRACSLLSDDRTGEFHSLITRSVQALMLFAVPAVILGMLFSREIAIIMGGSLFVQAALPLLITMPLLFVIGYEQVLIVQVLMPLGKDKAILANSIVGAAVGVLGNVLIVPDYGAVGAAAVWLAAEISVLISAQIYAQKYAGVGFPILLLAKSLCAYAPFAAICIGMAFIPVISPVARLAICSGLLVPYTIIVQKCVLHNPLYGTMVCEIKKMLRL